MDARDLPRDFGRPKRRVKTAALANVRRAAQRVLADAAAVSSDLIASAEHLLAAKPSTLAKACGVPTAKLQATLGEACAMYSRRERERTPAASTEALGKRVAVLVALSLAKEIAHHS